MSLINKLNLQTGQVLVAASNTVNELKAYASYTCDGVDDAAEINAALVAYPEVKLLPGTYTLGSASGGIVIPASRKILRGTGYGTLIQNNGTVVPTALSCTAGISEVVIEDLRLSSTTGDTKAGTHAAGSVGLDFSNIPLVYLSRVRASNYAVGLKVIDTANLSFYCSYRDFYSFENFLGISIGGTQANHNIYDNAKVKPPAGQATSIGVQVVDARGVRFEHLNVEASGTAANNGKGVTLDATTRGCLFTNAWIENNLSGVEIAAGAVRHVFEACVFTGNTTDKTDSGTNTQFIACETTGTLLQKIDANSP